MSQFNQESRLSQSGTSAADPSSPICVIDEALKFLDSEKADSKLCIQLFANTTMTTSSFSDDDSGSISSVSVDASDASTEVSSNEPRSIFKKYWNKKQDYFKQESSTLPLNKLILAGATNDTTESSSCSSLHSENTYERSLHKAPKQPAVPRRRIFGQLAHVESMPSFRKSGCYEDRRRTRSMSALQKKPLRSCFRKNSESHSVSFKPEVNVVVFQPPQERWAASGWSDYFAS